MASRTVRVFFLLIVDTAVLSDVENKLMSSSRCRRRPPPHPGTRLTPPLVWVTVGRRSAQQHPAWLLEKSGTGNAEVCRIQWSSTRHTEWVAAQRVDMELISRRRQRQTQTIATTRTYTLSLPVSPSPLTKRRRSARRQQQQQQQYTRQYKTTETTKKEEEDAGGGTTVGTKGPPSFSVSLHNPSSPCRKNTKRTIMRRAESEEEEKENGEQFAADTSTTFSAHNQSPANTIVVFDFETTGLSPALGHRAIEIGAVRLVEGVLVEQFQELMNPGVPVSAFITQYTGITNAMLADAESCATVMARFLAFIGEDNLVAHNASFDQRFLDAEVHRLSLQYSGHVLCSLLASRRIFPQAPNHRLSTLVEHVKLAVPGTFHRALFDAQMTAGIWLKMLEQLRQEYGFEDISFTLMQKLTKTAKKSLNKMLLAAAVSN